LLPGVPVIDDFPDYTAGALDTVRWYIGLCEWWYNCPPIIPINCIATELAPVLDKQRDYSIWNINGYSVAVDHDSYGQHQQRWRYYPFPWNFQTAAWSFRSALDRELGSEPYPDGDDPDAVGEIIQQTQKSAFPDAYRADYDWARALVDEAI